MDPTTATATAVLDVEIADVETQLGRIDVKAGLLLGLTGAAATAGPVVITGAHLPEVAAAAAWTAVVAFTHAAVSLAVAVRPALVTRSRTPYGFMRYAGRPVETILAELGEVRSPQMLARRLADVAAATAAKYRRIRLAVDVLLLGIACALAAALLAVAGR